MNEDACWFRNFAKVNVKKEFKAVVSIIKKVF